MQSEFNQLENPMHELMDLHVRTIQNLQYLNPTKAMTLQKPGDVLEHNVDLMIRNSHQVLDYWQGMFHIMDRWFNNSTNEMRQSYEMSGNRDSESQNRNRGVQTQGRSSSTGSTRLKSKSSKSSGQSSVRKKKDSVQARGQSHSKSTPVHQADRHHASAHQASSE